MVFISGEKKAKRRDAWRFGFTRGNSKGVIYDMKVSGELYVEEEWDERKQTKSHVELYGAKTDPEQSSFKFAVL